MMIFTLPGRLFMREVLANPTTLRIRIESVLQRKFFLLFLFLLSYLILYPYGQHTNALLYRVFGIAVTLLSVYAVSFRRTFIAFALVLAVPTLAQRIVLPRADTNLFALLGTILSLGFDVFIVVVIFRRVFAERTPNSDAIFGALCIYLMAGFSFASLYFLMATLQPGAFYLDPTANSHHVADRFDLIYYSFGTMTSLGAAGITPVSDQARSVSVIEAILGVLYLAVLIARLMSAYRDPAK
ncbi:MAG TPA: ion channel [Bryobacteraceae bacterium]|nr:ion channel [Bryobacteraceae bacterium]